MKVLPRILVVNSSDAFGGSEKVLWNILHPWLVEGQKDLCKVLLPGKGHFSGVAESNGLGVGYFSMGKNLEEVGDSPVRDHSFLRIFCSLLGCLNGIKIVKSQIGKHVKEFCPDLVLANGFKGHIFSTLSINKSIPILLYFQDFLTNRKVVSKILPRLVSQNTILVADSNAVANDLKKVFYRKEIIIWRNTVDTNFYKPAQEHEKSLAVSSKRYIRVGLVSTFARWKGHETFFRAARIVLENYGDSVHFVVVGGPVYKSHESQWSFPELQERARLEGLGDRIQFLGFKKDIKSVYNELDIVVHASTEPEPFGQVIIEAMACAKPVIIAAHGGAAEIGKNEVDMLHHVPGDSQSLANAILLLVKNDGLREKIALAGRRAAIENFDVSEVYKRWAKLFSIKGMVC